MTCEEPILHPGGQTGTKRRKDQPLTVTSGCAAAAASSGFRRSLDTLFSENTSPPHPAVRGNQLPRLRARAPLEGASFWAPNSTEKRRDCFPPAASSLGLPGSRTPPVLSRPLSPRRQARLWPRRSRSPARTYGVNRARSFPFAHQRANNN